MKALDNTKIQTKLYVLVALPVVALLCFCALSLARSYNEKQEMSQMVNMLGLAEQVSRVVHGLQVERGLTVPFLISKGEKNSTLLTQHRTQVDEVIDAYRRFTRQLPEGGFTAEVAASIGDIERHLENVENKRRAISDLAMSAPGAVALYTQGNEILLSLISVVSRQSSVLSISVDASSYFQYQKAKEYAGIERAVLNGVFTKSQFDLKNRILFLQVAAKQQESLSNFRQTATRTLTDIETAVSDHPVMQAVSSMRDIAIEDGALGRVSADVWFKQATRRIDLMNEVATAIILDIKGRTKALQAQALSTFYWVLFLVGVLTALLSFVTLLVIRKMQKSVEHIIVHAEHIANENYDHRSSLQGGDEFAQISMALTNMQSQLKAQIISERSLSETAQRIQSALYSASSPVMVLDNKGCVIFVNHSLERLFQNHEAKIRAELPHFRCETLLGSSVGVLAKHIEGFTHEVRSFEKTCTRRFLWSGITLVATFSPIRDESDLVTGFVIEWRDLTQDLITQTELTNVVESALKGDLSGRIALDEKQDFHLQMSEGMNQLLGVCEQVLNDISQLMSHMAEGDLRQRIDSDFEGEFERIKSYSNRMVNKLIDVLGNIQAVATQVNLAAAEISRGNLNLNERTERQAQAIESITFRVENITDQIKTSAGNARLASTLSQAAKNAALEGGEVVQMAIASMQQISASSREIAEINNVIDEIAFQTNLLALNASVEAARAGEQGRGFAVVADEVRTLASRSARAAQQIKDLINDSVDKVEKGAALVDDSGVKLQAIVNSVNQATDVVDGIDQASVKQLSEISEVGSAMAEMDLSTQQNAALVEEVSAASLNLNEQAEDLHTQLAFFKSA